MNVNKLNEPILSINNVIKSFGSSRIIDDISLIVNKGERHAIIGPNGAGKTTLFNLLTGKYRPEKGTIYFKNADITGLSPHAINRKGLARSFQITDVFPGLTVMENIRAVILAKHNIRYNFLKNVDKMTTIFNETLEILQKIGLEEKKCTLAGELSYGEQRALEIGLALASDPELILLDEPTAGMSIDETRKTILMIDQVTLGKTLIIIEHDMEVVFSLADVITVINYGKILISGPPDIIRGHPEVIEAYLGSLGNAEYNQGEHLLR